MVPAGAPSLPPVKVRGLPKRKGEPQRSLGGGGGWRTFKLDSAAVCCDEGREGREGYFELARRFCRRLCETN